MSTFAGGCLREADRLVDEGLVGHHLAAAHAGVGGDHHLRLARRRCASRGSRAAKPPNTTEWIAPMRAQASIANTASGIIGM